MTKPGVCVLCWAQCCLLLHSSWELWSCPSPLYFILSSLPSNKEPSILKVLWLFTDYACYKLYLKKCLKLFCWLLSGSCQYWPSWCSITLGCINIKDTFLCWLLDGFVNVIMNRIGSKQSIPLRYFNGLFDSEIRYIPLHQTRQLFVFITTRIWSLYSS